MPTPELVINRKAGRWGLTEVGGGPNGPTSAECWSPLPSSISSLPSMKPGSRAVILSWKNIWDIVSRNQYKTSDWSLNLTFLLLVAVTLLPFTCSQPDARVNERTCHQKYLLSPFPRFSYLGLSRVLHLFLVCCLQLPDRIIAKLPN